MFEVINIFLLELAPLGITILGTAATVGISMLLKKYSSKLDADLAKVINDVVMDTVIEGVGYVEQIAKQAQQDNEQFNGKTKLHKAAVYIRTELEKRGIVDVTTSEIRGKIESVLGQGLISEPILFEGGGTNDEDQLLS